MVDQDKPIAEMVLTLMRDVRDRLDKFERKLDDQIGRNETVAAIDVRVRNLEESHKWVKGMLGTVIGSAILALVYKLVR